MALLGQRPGPHLHVLPDRAEIRWQPIGDDDDAPFRLEIERALLQ